VGSEEGGGGVQCHFWESRGRRLCPGEEGSRTGPVGGQGPVGKEAGGWA
jgi:hypothetical protein